MQYAFVNPTTNVVFYFIPQHILVGWKHTSANMQEVSRIQKCDYNIAEHRKHKIFSLTSFFGAASPL